MAIKVDLDHVQVAAPPGSEAQARAFYGDLLGLDELERPELFRSREGVWFALGRAQLHIGIEEDFRPALKAHPAVRLADAGALEALAARLLAGGAPARWDEEIPGVRRFFTDDPWGNRLEFLTAA